MIETLLPALFEGRKAAIARAVSIVEDRRDGWERLLAACHPRIGGARRIGITGPPGAGKSTLTTLLAELYLEQGLRVGVVAVDPTSPFTGGALLGDRIRMEKVALREGVFIRSMATRGSLGGLAAATREVCDVLDAAGMQRILVETVGVGQSELEIARLADSSAVVLVPESGDSIQTLKAGVMEIADLFVVNKADRPGAERLGRELELMLGLRSGRTMRDVPAHGGDASHSGATATGADDATAWTPPVLQTIGATGDGVPALAEAFERHFAYLEASGALQARRRARLRERVVDAVHEEVRARLWRDADLAAWLDGRLGALERGTTTPLAEAKALLAQAASRGLF
ncbi:MAG: methylmalonyl Co-A mutase-associated GTPase MeaB [Gemmatimonadaceae bacterium]|nr:methylmalonyl Co-A mutase-associated GTPase MeaB [Gemmatimonadaceae bacterium]